MAADLVRGGGFKTRLFFVLHHALQRKSHLCIPFQGIARSQSQFPHFHVSVGDLYTVFPRSYFLQQKRQIDLGNI
jgi:hypothetical protein